MIHRSVFALAVLLAASPAFAAADLTVSITPPAGIHLYQSGHYTVNVQNIGNKGASNVSLTIQLPPTHTSPQVYILGDLGSFDGRCVVSGTKLVCSLGAIAKLASASPPVWFDIALPYSTAPLVITAAVTTTSVENTTANNSASHTANLLDYAVAINPPRNAVNRHCTGTGLTSFFECELFPSSISSHDTVFNPGGTISFPGAPASYTGTWTQPTPDHLLFQYFDNGLLVASFDGYGVSGACFEGKTTFPNSTYMSMYEVCLQ